MKHEMCNLGDEQKRPVNGTELGSFEVVLDFTYMPTWYLGQFIASVGGLYRCATDDDLYVSALESGSIKLTFSGVKGKIARFSQVLRKFLGSVGGTEGVRRVFDANIEAIVSELPDRQERRRAATEHLIGEKVARNQEGRLEIVKTLPVFIKEMTQLRKDLDPDASTADLREAARDAGTLYCRILGISEDSMLASTSQILGASGSINDLKERISIIPNDNGSD